MGDGWMFDDYSSLEGVALGVYICNCTSYYQRLTDRMCIFILSISRYTAAQVSPYLKQYSKSYRQGNDQRSSSLGAFAGDDDGCASRDTPPLTSTSTHPTSPARPTPSLSQLPASISHQPETLCWTLAD
jgi:hypothetical protein